MPTSKKHRNRKSQASTPLDAARLIIATNRGPVEFEISKEKKLKSRRGAGGVVTALTDALSTMPATWVALAMTEGDRLALKESQNGIIKSPIQDLNVQLRYVEVPRTVYKKHYDTMSNRILWFTQHYLLEQGEEVLSAEKTLDAWDHGYTQVNQKIANAVCLEIERGKGNALVMLHDYQLYLAALKIRERCPETTIQQFIHIPWPEVRYWNSSLPTTITQAIFSGLLGNDILGFQTRNDAQNFLEGIRATFPEAKVDRDEREIEYQGRRTFVRDYPISISVSEERHSVQSSGGKRAAERVQPFLRKYTIMRVDRIEPTKNIVQGFRAYETLLERYPELHEQITFLAFLVPSRQSLARYRTYQDEIFKIIEDINQKYGRNGWKPVQSFVQNDRTMALAALQFYDVLLVNSLIDGMNLVAKEGPVVNKVDGVLVLSRTSGAFQQLGEASVPISPADNLETADALYKALTLSADERKRLAQMAREEVEHNDLATWIRQQLADINDLLKTRQVAVQ